MSYHRWLLVHEPSESNMLVNYRPKIGASSTESF